MKFIVKFLKVILKLLKPLISMGLFDSAIEDALSELIDSFE